MSAGYRTFMKVPVEGQWARPCSAWILSCSNGILLWVEIMVMVWFIAQVIVS